MDAAAVNETVEKVDHGLEELGIEGVGDDLREILNFKEYFAQQIPSIVGFGIKVILAIVVFFVGRKLIQWCIRFLKRSMEKTKVDEGVIQFA